MATVQPPRLAVGSLLFGSASALVPSAGATALGTHTDRSRLGDEFVEDAVASLKLLMDNFDRRSLEEHGNRQAWLAELRSELQMPRMRQCESVADVVGQQLDHLDSSVLTNLGGELKEMIRTEFGKLRDELPSGRGESRVHNPGPGAAGTTVSFSVSAAMGQSSAVTSDMEDKMGSFSVSASAMATSTVATSPASRHTSMVPRAGVMLEANQSRTDCERRIELLELDAMDEVLQSVLPNNTVSHHLKGAASWLMRLNEPQRTGALATFIRNPRFEWCCALVIILNCVFAGYVADWEIIHVKEPPTILMCLIELVFLLYYTAELLLKIVVHKGFFLCNREWKWNNFDTIVVMVSLYDASRLISRLLGQDIVHQERGMGVTFMRALRLLKLTKIMRLFRVVKFVQQLRLMLLAIQHSFSSLFWCIVLLALVLYMFGLVLLQGFSTHLALHSEELTESEYRLYLLYFGSVRATALTLYKATTGGEDWGMYYEIISKFGPLYSSLFIFYTAFFTFTVMNVLTAVIVENVVATAQRDNDCIMLAYRQHQALLMDEIQRLFRQIDVYQTGSIDLRQFEDAMELEAVQALMDCIDLTVRDASWFFSMILSLSESNVVDIDHFVEAVMKMKGNASSLDLQCLSFEVRHIRKSLHALHHKLTDADSHAALHHKSLGLPGKGADSPS